MRVSATPALQPPAAPALLRFALLVSTLACVATGAEPEPARRPEVTLRVGDPAPALATGRWIQGEPVEAFDRDHAYLVEFWATWCGPCKAAIPHLNALHEKFKDRGFVVIGQDVWETAEDAVEPFVAKMGDKMTYRVALDDKSGGGKGRMAESWLTAAGRNGIPASFLIDKQGTVVWIGHPMQLEEPMIEAVLAGTFKVEDAVAAERERTEAQARIAGLTRDAYAALQAERWEEATAAAAELEEALPPSLRFRADSLRVAILLGRGEPDKAAALAERVADGAGANLPARNLLASQLATTADPTPAVLDAAERIASKANETLGGIDIGSLVTLARIAFLKGDQEHAIELQAKAVELSKPNARPRMQAFLDSYRAGKLPDDGRSARRVVIPAQPGVVPN